MMFLTPKSINDLIPASVAIPKESTHLLLACQVADGVLVLDDGAFALWNGAAAAALSEMTVVNVE